MITLTIELLTATGIADYPEYTGQPAIFENGSNINQLNYLPFAGESLLKLVAIQLDEGRELPINEVLAVGDVVTFPPGAITETEANPVILRGAPYFALVRARQILVELMDDSGAIYATQSMPEPDIDFSAVYISSSTQSENYFNVGFEDGRRFYDFNCTASILVIRNATTAHSFLAQLLAVLQTRRGQYWQFERNVSIEQARSVENSSPLLDEKFYQQQAQLQLEMAFAYRHYEQEGWLESATVNGDVNGVIVVSTGE
ncbi:hypothetical protein [Yersinia massiliensis]|uniref:hypothetical protein n=1 Tax=Yersinia massiliensis TaxID=419257 RepID=UPI001CFEA791|nr:hypothetical protein [Yersinia massiliensis]MCB5308348.1 hypothetical protein [Yersinia massiliensis]